MLKIIVSHIREDFERLFFGKEKKSVLIINEFNVFYKASDIQEFLSFLRGIKQGATSASNNLAGVVVAGVFQMVDLDEFNLERNTDRFTSSLFNMTDFSQIKNFSIEEARALAREWATDYSYEVVDEVHKFSGGICGYFGMCFGVLTRFFIEVDEGKEEED